MFIYVHCLFIQDGSVNKAIKQTKLPQIILDRTIEGQNERNVIIAAYGRVITVLDEAYGWGGQHAYIHGCVLHI